MILRLLDRLVSSFSIFRLIVASLIARLVALFLLPNSPSFLAPDEGTYASLALWVADSKDVEDFPVFGPRLYNTSKTLVMPAAALIKFGLSEITAVRVVSIGFGIASIYLFARIILLTLGVKHLQDLQSVKSQRFALMGMCAFAFLPSSFIWSTLGLRESSSMAMVLASAYLILCLRDSRWLKMKPGELKSTVLISIFGILTISLSFGARRQTAIVFVVFFCVSLALMSIGKNFRTIAVVVVAGTAFGLLFSTTPNTRDRTELVWAPIEKSSPVASDLAPPKLCTQDGIVLKSSSGSWVCIAKVVTEKEVTLNDVIAQAPVKNLDQLENQREANREGAQTQLLGTKCTLFTNLSYENIACNLRELPYRLASILFRPLPFIDQGSLSNNLASAENIIWIMFFALFAYSFITSVRKNIKLYLVLPTTIYVLAFANLSALYEGNLGTAFRHKSTILWGLILVVTVVFSANRTDLKEVNEKS